MSEELDDSGLESGVDDGTGGVSEELAPVSGEANGDESVTEIMVNVDVSVIFVVESESDGVERVVGCSMVEMISVLEVVEIGGSGVSGVVRNVLAVL